MRKFISLKSLLSVSLATSLIVLTFSSVQGLERIRWKMQSAWGAKIVPLGPTGLRIQDTVKALSDGKIQIRFHEPNALVPTLEIWGAVKNGSLDAGFTTPGYHAGYVPAVSFFSAVPFGPGVLEYTAWMDYGGGNEIKEKIYGEHGLYPLKCLIIAPETSGWFRKKYTRVEELKGMKMRFFGLGARVMQKIGVSTQLLAGGDIFPALEKGVIDATEFSMPTMDIKYGFYQIAKNNYFPGWHQQVSISQLLINSGKWKGLADNYKAMVEVGCGDSIHHTYAETEYKNPFAMVEMGKKYGVITRRWRDDQIAVFEKAWNSVMEEDSAKDPTFKRVAESYKKFRTAYAKWGNAQSLKPTYLK